MMTLTMGRNNRRMLALIVAIGLFGLVALPGCEEKDPISADGISGPAEDPVDNEAPETYLTLQLPPGVLPDTSRSAKTINWWGEDADGRVTGYEYRWGLIDFDANNVPVDTAWYDSDFNFVTGSEEVWTATSSEEMDFVLPIRTVSATFTLQVRARDNDGSLDSSPASISFPIINSRPEISFRLGSNPREFELADPDTAYTFTARTFIWDASDPDGNSSIDKVLYALDPQPGDTAWQEIAGTEPGVTLENLEPGPHVFWVKVEDVAGFQSPPIHFPDNDTTDTDDPAVWMVKQPAPGGFLIVDDYAQESSNQSTEYYAEILNDLYNDGNDGLDEVYSVWELTVLPYAAQDVTLTLNLFDNVIWYGERGTPLITDAFSAMYSYINTPGKRLLLSTVVVDVGEEGVDEGMLVDLADSATRFPTRVIPTDDNPIYLQPVDVPELPELELDYVVNPAPYGLTPSESAEVLYQLNPSTMDPPQYEGTPVVGARRPDKSYTLMTFPLHLLIEQDEVAALVENTFAE